MIVPVEIVNAFIDGDNGGNPAGVVLDANSLSSEQKLKVAQKVGLSETAFVSESQVATIKRTIRPDWLLRFNRKPPI